jgi:hypothetical protein
MSRGLRTRDLPKWIKKGIDSAFKEWLNMSGEWLNSAPEYMVTVNIAQQLKKNVSKNRRSIFMEPSVAKTLDEAGGIQPGPNAKKLRSTGRYDIVIGHQNFRPRAIIEVKSPMWHPMQKSMVKDLNRLCGTLLQNRDGTHIHSALMAMYVSARTPKAIDESAMSRLNRKWAVQMPKDLELCGWAGGSKAKYLKFLNFDTHIHLHDHWVGDELFAWGSVCIEITRKPPSQIKNSI